MQRYVVIDLETTGNTPAKTDKIIEVGIVVIEQDTIVDSYSTLLHPNKEIPAFITNLTGISNEDVADAPLFENIADEVTAMFENSYLIAHNVPFDLGFLNEELTKSNRKKLKNPVLDTVELARILFPSAPSFKLNQLTDYLQINHENPHRALSDAFVTAKLFLKLKEKLASLPYETLEQLLRLEKWLKSDAYALFNYYKEQNVFVEKNDEIAIYQGLAYRCMNNLEKEDNVIDLSFGDYLDSIYESNGSLEKNLSFYEKRAGQREMSEMILDAFQTRQHALIEAETGTGKSLAYLLPAIYDAVSTHKRVVISTYTTQLQTQLLEEEIPLIRRLIPFPFRVALLKGKGHYISLEKLHQELLEPLQINYDIALTVAMLLVWLTETETGDIDDIQLPSSGYLFFRRISADMEEGVDPSSQWFYRSHYQYAKKRAQQAHIVITNHALLCTDIFHPSSLLPVYERAIIDEAHHFEATVSKHYGLKLDYMHMHYTFNQLGRTDEQKLVHTILSHYPSELSKETKVLWNKLLDDTRYETDDLFRYLFQYVSKVRKGDKSFSDIGRTQYRFEANKEDQNKWTVIKEMVSRVCLHLRDLVHGLVMIEAELRVNQLHQEDKEKLLASAERLQVFIDQLEQFFLVEDSVQEVKWMEIEAYGAKNAVYLYSEPTDIANLLTDLFFSVKESIVLTSATLTMENSFQYIMERLGLQTENPLTKKIVSPFSYADQVQLMVPNDFPTITSGHIDDFIHATCEAVLSLAEITNGRMLVLFTSYDMLRRSHSLLKELMENETYALIAQGISSGSRERLKKNFQTFDRAILLGTSSFWEGVDIPGEDLSCLVIVRLPFQPPDHPVLEAKSNFLKEQGKNPFMQYALPNAVIRFKQGFGRLIRSSSDRGIVFICDARIVTARYGKYFIRSIPKVPLFFDTTHDLMIRAEKWF